MRTRDPVVGTIIFALVIYLSVAIACCVFVGFSVCTYWLGGDTIRYAGKPAQGIDYKAVSPSTNSVRRFSTPEVLSISSTIKVPYCPIIFMIFMNFTMSVAVTAK